MSGLTAMLTAAILMIAAWFTGEQKIFNPKELWLILLSFALLTVAAHCLDNLEKVSKTSDRK